MSAVPEDDVLLGLIRGSLDHCVKCTICETHCPYSNATSLFPGPKYVGPQAERFRTGEEVTPDASVDYCSSCGICTQVCPQGVHIAEINTRAKARLAEAEGVPLRDQLLGRPDRLGLLGTPVAPLANWTLANRPLRALAQKVAGHPQGRRAPDVRGAHVPALGQAPHAPAEATKEVVFFHGCGTNYYEPDLGEKTVAILEHNGFKVDVPKQGCCGLPLQSNGIFPAAAATRAPGEAPRAARARGQDDRRRRDELHAHGQARGPGDPRARRRPRRPRRLRAHLRHLRVPARPARPRRAAHRLRAGRGCRRLPRALPAAGPRHRQAGARPLRSSPGSRRRDATRLLRDRRHLRAQGGEAPDLARRRRRPFGQVRDADPTIVAVRQRDLPLAHRAGDRGHQPSIPSRSSTAPTGLLLAWSRSWSSRTARRWPRA